MMPHNDKETVLEDDLAACRREKEEYLGGWQRAQADFVNAKRLWEEKYVSATEHAERGIITKLLSIANIFERAFEHSDDANAHVQGFRQIQTQLTSLLESYGVTRIPALHASFDVEKHEAIETVPVTDQTQDGIVLEELEPGYIRGDIVLKPSKVRVGTYQS